MKKADEKKKIEKGQTVSLLYSSEPFPGCANGRGFEQRVLESQSVDLSILFYMNKICNAERSCRICYVNVTLLFSAVLVWIGDETLELGLSWDPQLDGVAGDVDFHLLFKLVDCRVDADRINTKI